MQTVIFIAKISAKTENQILQLKAEIRYYGKLDRTVPLAILAARKAISDKGIELQKSMNQVLNGIDPAPIDAIILHAPGTIQGDQSEINAIQAVFNQKIPKLTTNKWKIGHTLGASAALSIQWAILMMQRQMFIGVPFLDQPFLEPFPLQKILINSIGFGGNAVSIIISKNKNLER